jgi:putative heme-binding domain-containing protein
MAATYAVTLPDFASGHGKPSGRDSGEDIERGLWTALPDVDEIDLQYDLTGVDATWQGEDGTKIIAVLPHFDMNVARALTLGSADHDAFWSAFEGAGNVVLNARLNLKDMLRPAVQPGAQIDYELPAEKIIFGFMAGGRSFHVALDGKGIRRTAVDEGDASDDSVRLTAIGAAAIDNTVDASVTVTKGDSTAVLGALWTVVGEEGLMDPVRAQAMLGLRGVALSRIGRPWDLTNNDLPLTTVRPKELDGGSWARGYKLFRSEQALCSKCHVMDGDGGEIGPNLSNLRQRDYASVFRDVTNPSYAINPDYISHALTLDDGRILTGVVRTDGDTLLLGDEMGNVTKIARGDVEAMQPSSVSVMPKDIHEKLGEAKLRDLLTFLLTPPPSMPLESKLPPPPPRSMDEVRAVLAGAPEPAEKTRSLRIVLVAGPKDHGPGEHDYPAWQKAWSELLAVDDATTVETAWEWPSDEQLAAADVLVVFQHGRFDAERAKGLDALLARGGGAVFIHWAVDGNPDGNGFAERIGLAVGKPIAFRHGPLDLDLSAAKHPITRNFDRVHFVDESYWKLVGDLTGSTLLGTSVEEGSPTPQLWAREHGKGRVFVSIPGHYSWSFDDPLFRTLLLRGIAWTAREPVDRYNKLITIGARMRSP